ncbi:hypothetical protein [Anaeroselena agilis]|uniref:Uncharacterized protein n=1 Tax=Anaeroselena agilis TaxID=3063788 RepID=A0ABU3P0I1_9FIRM|nr:hypothetical protein [Selenomonadales bacterium 4137-cl]
MKKMALVLGGGDAGVHVAMQLADRGHLVTLVPFSPSATAAAAFQELRHPNIHTFAQAELISLRGGVGNFTAHIGPATPVRPIVQIRAGAIILTTESEQAAALPRIAALLGIALNDYGSVATNQFCPVLTSREGIFVVDGGKRPANPADYLAMADKAATMAACVLEASEGEAPPPAAMSGIREISL